MRARERPLPFVFMLDTLHGLKTCGLDAILRQIWNVAHTSTCVPHYLQLMTGSNGGKENWYEILPDLQPRRLRSIYRLLARVPRFIQTSNRLEKMRNEKGPGQERPASLKRKIADRLCNTRQEQVIKIDAHQCLSNNNLRSGRLEVGNCRVTKASRVRGPCNRTL